MRLLLPLALAHVPHDVITAIAPAPDLDPARPWWLVADHDDASDLYRSDDGGLTWDGVAAAPLAEKLRFAVTLDDGAAVLVGETSAWWTTDGSGSTWSPVPLPFEPTAAAGGSALHLGAADGVWTLLPDGRVDPVFAGLPVASLTSSREGVAAVAPDGTVAWSSGGAWLGPSMPPEPAYSAVVHGGEVYAGSRTGAVYRRLDTGWAPCAPTPLADTNPVHPEVVRLASDGATLALAHADIGPAWTDDRCATWSADPAPVDLVWIDDLTEDDYYDYTELDEAFTALGVGSGRFVVGTYDGAATRIDGSWHEQPLKGADYARGTAFSTAFPSDGAALLAVYGCGIQRALAYGAEWDCPGAGLDKPAAQRVLVPDDAEGLVPAYALSNRVPVRSDDGGATWVDLDYPGGPTHDLAVGIGGRVWAVTVQTAEVDAPGSVLRSDDEGASWSGVPGLAVVGDRVIGGLVDRPGLVAAYTADLDAATAEAVYLAADGETFELATEIAEGVADAAAWPPSAPRRVVLVGPGGVDLGEAGRWWRPALPESVGLRRVVVAPDGTVVVSTRTQRLWASGDGGETWSDLGVALPGQVEALAAHPDFGRHPAVVAMTPAGTWAVGIDGHATRWAALQQADDMGHYAEFVRYDPDGGDVPREGAALGSVHELAAGGSATVWLRGVRVEVVGETVGVAVLQLVVDGELAAQARVEDLPLGSVLVAADGLEDRFHEVSLVVIEGDPVRLDHARGWSVASPLGHEAEPDDTGGGSTDSEPPSPAEPGPTDDGFGGTGAGRCACASRPAPGSVGPWALVAWALLFRRRRR